VGMEQRRRGAGRLQRLLVEDDGPGIPRRVRARVLNRGVRADQQQPGQGIGLSVAGEIAGLYGGRLSIGGSELGGALIQVEFPQT